ncbi:MAG: penicillin acylase family protein [Bacillota bacterium]|nr:penicillin acylase family protein [Bacillota bacterium]
MRASLGRGLGAAVLSSLLVVALFLPLGPLPPLGPTFEPTRGVFAGSWRPVPERLRIAGLQAPVTVDFDRWGVPHIFAQNDHDLFFAQGYLTGRERLLEMELLRRQSKGRLAEILGPAALPSDRFQLTLGLWPTAQASAERIAREEPRIHAEMEAYAQGVNAWIREASDQGRLPALFGLLRFRPAPWTVADSLVVQGFMAEDLAFSTSPLERAAITARLGAERANALFRATAVNPQFPYDPGPYPPATPPDRAALERVLLPFAPGAGVGGLSARAPLASRLVEATPGAALPPSPEAVDWLALDRAVRNALAGGPVTGSLASGLSDSNNWVVDGTLTATGKPLLAGDPHLALTLPSIWYEIHLEAPDLHVYGVSIPGTPGVIIGHNRNVAWSLTNVQNQQSFYYVETTDPAHPGLYLHGGRWLRFATRTLEIPVKGRAPERFTLRWTVHGPVLPADLPGFPPLPGRVVSLAWTGNLFSDDFAALDALMRAQNATGVRAALRRWGSPTQNFAYATTQGDIGILSAGYYPLVEGGQPWLPLDGSDPRHDWQGLIPYERVPQVANPASHFAFTSNQREVGPDYPYYIGTTESGFDAGYRAATVHAWLGDPAHRPLTRERMAELQSSRVDSLALRLVPVLVAAVRASPASSPELRQSADLLQRWDGRMAEDQAAPAIWWSWLSHYLEDTFGPWWEQAGLERFPDFRLKGFQPAQSGWRASLLQALEVMTTAPAGSALYKSVAYPAGSDRSWFFDPVQQTDRSREEVMLQALGEAVADLRAKLGDNPARWRWGDLHRRLIPSLTQRPALGRGPFPTGGDAFTVDVSGGEPSTHGPSWRMIADLADLGHSWGIFPGGESGDPTSPHYADQLPLWTGHRYKELRFPGQPMLEAGGWAVAVSRFEPAGGGK